MIKLSGLSHWLLYSVFYFYSVVCRLLSVSHQVFKHQWLFLQQRVHNPTYTNQPLPRHILNLTVVLFSQTHISGGVIKTILVSIICVTFNLDTCKVSFLNYLQIFLNFENRVPDVRHAQTHTKACQSATQRLMQSCSPLNLVSEIL